MSSASCSRWKDAHNILEKHCMDMHDFKTLKEMEQANSIRGVMTVAKDHGLGAECASLQVLIIIIITTTTIIIIIIITLIIVIIRRQNMLLVLALLRTWWSLTVL